MHWRIITVGKPSLAYARMGAEEYLKRLQPFAKVEHLMIKDGVRNFENAAKGSFTIALDLNGQALDTYALKKHVDQWEQRGEIKRLAILIGGADGLPNETLKKADLRLSLSKLTLMHELALLVFLEQLYRLYTIKKNLPYHR